MTTNNIDTGQHMQLSAERYRDQDRNEFTQVTASCECGRSGWIRLSGNLEADREKLIKHLAFSMGENYEAMMKIAGMLKEEKL